MFPREMINMNKPQRIGRRVLKGAAGKVIDIDDTGEWFLLQVPQLFPDHGSPVQ